MTRVLFPLLLIVACAQAARDTEGGPVQAIPPPAPQESTFVIPIRTNLSALTSQVDGRVPPQFAGSVSERGIDVEYDVKRDPIDIRAIGQGIHASSAVHYWLQACRGRFPCVSCGLTEPRRTAEIKLHTSLRWAADWKLHSTTRPLPVHYPSRCAITWFDIDVTRHFVAPVVESELKKIAATIDRETPRLTNFRPQAEKIWTSLQAPIEVAPRTWLLIEPSAVSLTPIRGSGTGVETTLHLRATTRMSVGARPEVAPRPLIPLADTPERAEPLVRVPLDVRLPYEEATTLAAREYAGRTLRVGTKPLKIDSVRVSFARDGRLRIDAHVDYQGGMLRNYAGPVVLEGTPRFDPVASRIVFPDLEYSLESRRSLLARLAERALHDEIRSRLRESMQINLAPRLATTRADVTRALQRTLAPGVTLNAQIRTLDVQGLVIHPEAIFIRLVAEGEATVAVR